MINRTSIAAIRTLQYLAGAAPGELVSLRDVAAQLGESATYSAKIARDLVKAGILHAERGAKGGVRLNQAPEEITLLEVLRACQGDITTDSCQTRCAPSATCSFHQAATELHNAVLAITSRWTLAQLLVRPVALQPGMHYQACRMANLLPVSGSVS